PKRIKKKRGDFRFGPTLGEGSYSTVILAREIESGREYAMKDSGDEPRSSSFVGTAQYVSPELLKDKKACKSSDLWALGCIVYQMLTGQFPFKAPNEYLIFQQIVNCKYEFPEDFDPNARDLISSLLQLDPMMRLGSSSCGGYEKLMEHPFFTGIDWENLANQAAPKTMLALAGDSSDEDTTVEDLADGFDQAFINDFKAQVIEESKQKGDSTQLVICDPTDNSGLGLPAVLPKEERERWMKKQHSSDWDYFAKGNLILKQGQLEKKRGFSVKLREFLLTEGPKLIYIDPNSKEVKGEIPWSSELRTEPKSFRIFFVHTPNRTYHLIDKSNNALIWCKKIEEIKKHYY
uniref:3-phosphoinositide-dependent protein kinase 1 n=1 Tax=Ciona savignyi TaxID=51511 RepID=H2YFH3_CIOSA